MIHRSQWRRLALAAAVAMLCSFTSISAQALGLGRITVQSALGEALRAEIDVPDISADEANSLRIAVAAPDAFKAAGLEYSAAVVAIQVSLQKRANGQSYLQLSSLRPVIEPFVDLILEASWASGRLVRDYTMLFDPPDLRQPAAPTSPILPLSPATAVAGIGGIPVNPSAPPLAQANTQVLTPPAPVAKPLVAQPSKLAAVPQAASSGLQVNVKPGDTAGKLVAQSKPASISLDQMLMALLRSNPDAFIGDNVNRLKSGAVLAMPAAEDAAAITPGEASRAIVAQSKDFNAFRQKLAANVPGAGIDSAKRQAKGKLQAKVEERAASSATPDKLTLSKGAVQDKTGSEDQLAKDRQAKDTSTRMAELAKNIGDLNKLADVTPAMSPSTSPALASTTSAESTPVAVKKPGIGPPSADVSLIDKLTDNAFVLPALLGLLTLLAGFAFFRYKNRNNAASVDNSFLESRPQPDQFFSANDGQRMDIREGGGATNASMVNLPSLLDTAGDVDPVAEADVYLAYGRDLQAEEILKEGLRTHPSRVAIHTKLMEIYAKRCDLQGFEVVSAQAFTMTQGNGPEWAYICEMGRDLDPSNVLYQAKGQQSLQTADSPVQAPPLGASLGPDPILQVLASLPKVTASPVDFHIGLNSPIDDGLPDARVVLESIASLLASAPIVNFLPSPPPMTAQSEEEALPVRLNMDFMDDAVAMQFEAPVITNNSLSFGAEPTPTAFAVRPDSGRLEFDLGLLSLDLDIPIDESPTQAEPALTITRQGLLAKKLALAEEYRKLGDSDSARSLANEVVSEAQASLKSKAQALLNALS